MLELRRRTSVRNRGPALSRDVHSSPRCLGAVIAVAALVAAIAIPAEASGATGSIVGWGYNAYGQATPPAGNDYVAIAAGDEYSLALKADGSIVGWGWDEDGRASPPAGNDYVAIAAGSSHSLALKADGSIVGWGANFYGQATPPAGNDYVAIAAGGSGYSLALKTDGTIVAWGANWAGQTTPPAGSDYVAIAAGAVHGLALKADGSIVGWGSDYSGDTIPPAGNDYVAIAAGSSHSLALKADGSIVGWGSDSKGQATPPAGNDFTAIAAGREGGLALKADGSIAGWGGGKFGESIPPAGNDYTAIAAGGLHSLALETTSTPVPTDLTLGPAEATNEVGTPHTVTATATDVSSQPVGEIAIEFTVSGANSAAGACTTASDGTCTFIYTGEEVGEDTISAYADNNGNEAQDEGEPRASASKTWTPLPPSSVSLSPLDSVNPVSTTHTVTATVDNAKEQPVGGASVQLRVNGSVSSAGSCTSGEDGTCSFSYAGPEFPGADQINAFVDLNGNESHDEGEPSAVPATKAWVLPETTAGHTTGGGQIWNAAETDKIAFGFEVKSDSKGLKGSCNLVDPRAKVKLDCSNVTALSASGTEATIYGEAALNGEVTTYRIAIDDQGEPGKDSDSFTIHTASGYQAGGVLTSGNVQVR